MDTLRPDLTPIPMRLMGLPRHRGYPVPFFVSWVNGEPDFRIADARKWHEAVTEKKCWVCGQRLGKFYAFVLGPMCGITRSTTEPPCHKECAIWSVQNCPFLVRPHMVRREDNLPEGLHCPGEMIARNPGVSLIWVTVQYRVFQAHNGLLIEVGEPLQILAYQSGQPATLAAVTESVMSGLPCLQEMTEKEPTEALRAKAMSELEQQLAWFVKLLEQNLSKERVAV